MKAILRTNDFTEGYKIVEILKLPISNKNSLALVKYNNEVFQTGGILCPTHELILEALSELSNEEQWKLLMLIKFPLVVQ